DDWVADKPTAQQLALYGLDKPTLTVQMVVHKPIPPSTQPEDVPMAVNFGQEVGGKRYARVQGREEVCKVSKSTVDKIDLPLDDLRDKHVAAITASDVARLVITGTDGNAELIKDSNQAWRMISPVAGPADGDAVSKLIEKITGLTAQSFDDDPTAAVRQSIESPRMKVILERGKDKPALTVVIGQASALGATAYLKNGDGPSIALVAAADVKDVLVQPISLANRAVWTIDQTSVRRIVRAGKAGDRTVEKVGNDWLVTDPIRMEAQADSMTNLLSKFAALKATQQTLLKPAEVGLDKPAVKLTFTYMEKIAPPATTQPTSQPAPAPKEVEKEHSIALVQKDAIVYAQANNSGPVYQLDSSLVEEANRELAKRTLVGSLEADKADSLTLETSAGKVDLNKTRDDWTLRQDPTIKIDPVKVQEAINSLAGLTVTRYVDFDCAAPAKYGLDQAKTKVVVGWPGAATTAPDSAAPAGKKVTFLVSDKGEEGSFYAMVAGDKKVGLVNPAELIKVQKDWKFFEKSKEQPAASPPPGGGMPGGMMPGGMMPGGMPPMGPE
ncbi:MAG: DUF4340 domain-containing protein, partial [Phycisphaerae bacterium]|nr:DUF4340 domain-containing protein [Phycisphaerae bacterium]